MFKLFRAGEYRRTDKSVVGQRLQIGGVKSFGQTEVDYFTTGIPLLRSVRILLLLDRA